MLPRDGERDNDAWTSARSAARAAIGKWLRLIWKQRSYQTREALPGYAPEPDLKAIPPFNDLVLVAVGPHGVINDPGHGIYRDLMGSGPATTKNTDDIDGTDL